MSASNAFESALLALIFENTAIADIGNVAGLQPSGVAGSLYIALHTANPGQAGNQSTSEATYTGYARVAVARSSAGWTISGSNPTQVANAAAVAFPACTAGTNTVTYFSIGSVSTGAVAGDMLLYGALTSSLAVSAGITPSFAIGALAVTLQ